MPDADLKICHVVNKVGPTSVPADIAKGLARYTAVDADILTWFGHDSFEGDDLIDIHDIDAPDTVSGIDIATFRTAVDLISGYDIVQTHHNHSGAYAKLVATVHGIPIVSTEQNNHDGFTTKGLIANGLTNPLATRVTCVSHTVADSLKWWERILLSGRNIEVIHNGVDLQRVEEAMSGEWSLYEQADVDPDSMLVGTAGMFTEQKALNVLVRATAEVTDSINEKVELVLAGDGEKRDELHWLSERLGIEDSVHFLGLIDRDEVYQMMAQLDIYAMPSRWEGFSAAAVEALAVGTPCVFSNIREFYLPFEGAALFHDVDDPDGLAECVSTLIEDEKKRIRIASRGRERAQDYSMQQIAENYRNLYRQIL